MKLRLLLLGVIILMSKPAVFAQTEIDVTNLLADPKVFIFNDQKNTVKEYIYGQISAKTSCCGSDRIYLEVKIDPSGHVLQVKTLTGKNDCFKKSAMDIVKNVKWDAAGFKGAKSVYFEIKPDVSCEGDRSNTYAALPVFNNPLLDDSGALKNTVAQTTTTVVTPKEEPKTEPAPTPEPVKETVAEVKEEVKEAVEPAKEAVAEVVETPPTPTPTPEPVKETVAEVKEEVKEAVATVEPVAEPAPQPEPVVVASNETPEPSVDASEITLLKQKMEELRIQEEEALEKQQKRQAYIERRRRAREARRQRILEQREAAANADAEGDDEDAFYDDEEDGDDGDPNRSRDEIIRDREQEELSRFRDEISRLEDRRRDIDDQQRRLEEEQRRTVDERQRIAQERVRIEEDIRRVEEESTQRREEYELQRLEEDLRRREEEKRQQEQEIQRMLAEIERLQREQDRRMQDLQKQEQDIVQLSDSKTLREQQIEADRLRRQKENEAAIKMMELQADLGTSIPTTQAGGALTSTPGLNQAMTTENDSEKILILINEISLLQEEIRQMQNNLYNIQQTGGSIPATGAPARGNGTQFTAPAGSKNASDDSSWEKVDYKDPSVPKDSYRSTEPEEPDNSTASTEESVPVTDAYDPVRGFSPDPSHKETHANVAGPQFSLPEFGEGEGAMKNFIKDKLREGGVCGLAQAFAEVTVDPSGTVIGYNVLKTNNTMVALRLPSVLRSLTFSPSESRIPQNMYVEFKADILCGAEDQSDVDLKEVDSYIKSQN